VREYDAEPESDFQKAMRRRTKDKKLYNHVTKTFTEMNVKHICNVPKRCVPPPECAACAVCVVCASVGH
jgi:hypothetical protein